MPVESFFQAYVDALSDPPQVPAREVPGAPFAMLVRIDLLLPRGLLHSSALVLTQYLDRAQA